MEQIMGRWLGVWAVVFALGAVVSGAVRAAETAGAFEWRAGVSVGEILHTWRHDDWVRAVAFSPDGRQVLTGSDDKTAVLRDLPSGRVVHTWQHNGVVWAVAFSPDGRQVLTGSNDGTAVLRDLASGQVVHTWQHNGWVRAVAFSPDGRQVLTGSDDKTAVLRDLASGQVVHTWQHNGWVMAVAFSPDGRQVLTGSGDKTAVLRDLPSGRVVHTWQHNDWVRAVAFSPDGRQVLTGSDDKTAVLRDLASGQVVHTWQHDGVVSAVAFSPDGRQVLTGSDDKTAVLRDLASGRVVHTWQHDGVVRAVAFSPDGHQVLTGSQDKTAVLRQVPYPSLEYAFTQTLGALSQRALPTALLARQTALAAERPATKDEFETQRQYAARIQAYNAQVTQLNQASAEHAARRLPLSARASAMQTAFVHSYGDPVLEGLRYDAEQGRFFARLRASGVADFTRSVTMAVPPAEARAAKASLEKDGVTIHLRVSEDNAVSWTGASFKAGTKTYLAQFTDSDFIPAAITVAAPTLTPIVTTPLATVVGEPLRVTVSDDPKLAKLQIEVMNKERAETQRLARESETKRLNERLAQLNATAFAPEFDDDLAALLAKTSKAKPDPHLHVLVVGITDYADVPDVPFADRSALAFADLAKTALGARPENIITLTNAEATAGRLRGRLRVLLNRLGREDRVLIYYAGHGVPAKDGKTAYLLAQDGGPGSYEDPALQLDTLYAEIEKSRVGQASLFIDACFSGRSGKESIVFEGVGGITLVPVNSVRPDSRLTVLTAGRSDQFSNQDKTHGHRLFGYHLMKSLLEGGKNQTASQLHATLRERVLSDSRRIGPEFEQDPELLGNAKATLGR
jgi:roadblock/LC7 domain-containing protein